MRRILLVLAAIIATAMLAVVGASYADNLQNDATTTAGITTITAGDSTTITYRLIGNNSPSGDVSGCDATVAKPVTVTINKPAEVSGPSSLQFTACGNPGAKTAVFSSTVPGAYAITHAISGGVTGSLFNNQANFTLTVEAAVPPNTAPSLDLPADQTVEATGAGGATVYYAASASDTEDAVVTPSCSPASGSIFPLGITQVNCSVTDSAGATTIGMFNVTVVDTTAPTLALPANITAEATGSGGATVTYAASASDLVDGSVAINCTPTSGSTFALGATTVDCSATDAHGNTASGSFTVTVVDTTPPSLHLPADITKEATGPSGAAVSFTATATDLVDGSVPVACTPSSGSTFALGATTVHCSATDAHDNTASGSFSVTVVDTTPPTLSLPSNITTPATGISGAVVTYSATASDLVDGTVPVSCSPASGSTFAPGTTTVDCSATDAANNTASGSFTVTVKFAVSGFYQPVDMTGPLSAPVWNTVKNGSTVPLKFEVFAGSTELTDVAAVNQPLKATGVTCASGTADDIELVATGGTVLRYDTTGGQFVYNWQTPKKVGACYLVTVSMIDGSSLSAYFKLK
jgi:hypothetical protein